MELILNRDCPIFDTINRRHLHRLLDVVVRGWHTIAHPPPEQLQDLVGEDAWSVYGDLILASYKTAASGRRLNGPRACTSCDAEALANFLCLPTLILLENPRSDGEFLHMVARVLLPRIVRNLRGANASVEIHHGGGITEIAREIPRLSQRYSRWRPEGLPARFVVFTDSDAKSPGRPDGNAVKVAAVARDAGVACHTLEQRSIENYIPDTALAEYASVRRDRTESVAVITGLDVPARNHYPMKAGLPAQVDESREDETLYPAGTPREFGLGDFVDDFLEVSGRNVTRSDLRSRDVSGDLDRLLDLVEENI